MEDTNEPTEIDFVLGEACSVLNEDVRRINKAPAPANRSMT